MKLLSIDPGTKHCAVCLIAFDNGGDSCVGAVGPHILFWTLLDIASHTPHAVRCALDAACANHHIDAVVIETQPPKNLKMRHMEAWLQMYFTCQDIKVHAMQAAQKIRYALHTGLAGTTKPLSYAGRKQLSVHVATALVQQQMVCGDMEAFVTMKKKDDLADALLQALACFQTLQNT